MADQVSAFVDYFVEDSCEVYWFLIRTWTRDTAIREFCDAMAVRPSDAVSSCVWVDVNEDADPGPSLVEKKNYWPGRRLAWRIELS